MTVEYTWMQGTMGTEADAEYIEARIAARGGHSSRKVRKLYVVKDKDGVCRTPHQRDAKPVLKHKKDKDGNDTDEYEDDQTIEELDEIIIEADVVPG